MDYEIVREIGDRIDLLETRSGDLPESGEKIEVAVDGQDVEWFVTGIETVNKRSGRVWRVTVNANDPSKGSVTYF